MKELLKTIIQAYGWDVLAKGCEVLMVEDNGSSLNEQLGVDDLRTRQLDELLTAIIESSKDPATWIVQISKECVHPNELALVCYFLGYTIAELEIRAEEDNEDDDADLNDPE